jgi:hypothetical protein
MIGRPEVTENREDISRFMIHLTRDDSGESDWTGQSASKNFLNIYNTRTLSALKAHCLHAWRMTDGQKEKCKVTCFSEMPLTAIRHVAKPIEGRRIELAPYGFVFRREFMLEKGAQQVTYVNSYEGNNAVRESYDRDFEIGQKNNFTGKVWKKLPFISAMSDRYDFYWEREWRILGDFEFNYSDLVCVILPEDKMGIFKTKLAQQGIAWISPEWGFERIVDSLSDQQRRTRKFKPIPVEPSIVEKKPVRLTYRGK